MPGSPRTTNEVVGAIGGEGLLPRRDDVRPEAVVVDAVLAAQGHNVVAYPDGEQHRCLLSLPGQET
jgi:hypothetical protein